MPLIIIYLLLYSGHHPFFSRLIVVSVDEINIFKFPDPIEHYRTIQTQPNPKGETSNRIIVTIVVF